MLIYGKDNRIIIKFGKWDAKTIGDQVVLRLEINGWVAEGVISKDRITNSNRKLRQIIIKMIASVPIRLS